MAAPLFLRPFANESIEWLAFNPPNMLLFERGDVDRAVWRVELDARLTRVLTPPAPVVEATGSPSVSMNGTLVTLGGMRRTDQQIMWVDRAGRQVRTFGRPMPDVRDITISPDGRAVATSGIARGQRLQIWIHNADAAYRLTNDPEGAQSPAWYPDGRILACASNAATGIFVRLVAEAAEPKLLAKIQARGLAWSPDGQHLVLLC